MKFGHALASRFPSKPRVADKLLGHKEENNKRQAEGEGKQAHQSPKQLCQELWTMECGAFSKGAPAHLEAQTRPSLCELTLVKKAYLQPYQAILEVLDAQDTVLSALLRAARLNTLHKTSKACPHEHLSDVVTDF